MRPDAPGGRCRRTRRPDDHSSERGAPDMAKSFKEPRDKVSPEAGKRVDPRVRETLLEMAVQEVHEKVSGETQAEVTEFLSVTRAAILQLEGHHDLFSVGSRGTRALGGNIEIIARLPTSDIRFTQFHGDCNNRDLIVSAPGPTVVRSSSTLFAPLAESREDTTSAQLRRRTFVPSAAWTARPEGYESSIDASPANSTDVAPPIVSAPFTGSGRAAAYGHPRRSSRTQSEPPKSRSETTR